MTRPTTAVLTDATPYIFSEHDALIQTLDRRSNGLYLTKECFMDTVDAWNGVPLIYAQQHPDLDAWDADPEAELKRIKGRLVKGQPSETYIELNGHPRLMTRFRLTDEEIEQGIKAGRISTSNGFRCRNNGDALVGTVRPHHILFFEEKDKGGPVPGDKGVVVLNTEAGKDPIAWLKALFTEWRKEHAGGDGTEEIDMAEAKELETKLANKEQELANSKLEFTQLQTERAKLDGEIKAAKAEIERLNAVNLAFLAKEKDAKWDAFKAKRIPPGMIAGEKETDARKEFEADPLTFMDKIMEFREKHPVSSEEDGDMGVQFTSQKPKEKAKKYEDQLREVGVPCISVLEGKGEN